MHAAMSPMLIARSGNSADASKIDGKIAAGIVSCAFLLQSRIALAIVAALTAAAFIASASAPVTLPFFVTFAS